LPVSNGGYRQVFPFQRSLIAIVIVAVMDVIFTSIAVTTFQEAAQEWGRMDSLFELVSALFLSAWLLGWSIAPLILTTILIIMLFGREVVRAREGIMELGIGIPGLVVSTAYDVSHMRNLRLENPASDSGKSWRGPHMAFDYDGGVIDFGSAVDPKQVVELANRVHMATGNAIGRGNTLPDEAYEEPVGDTVDLEPAMLPEPLSAQQPAKQPLTLSSPSILALIVANLLPVFGAMFLGWKLADVMVIYWAESAVIGFFNVCKMAVINRWMVLIMGPFFIGHFGGFMSIHFLFIYTIFIEGPQASATGGDLADVAQLFIDLWPALAMLFISHGISFFSNFIGRREYAGRNLNQQMTGPYSRIIFMHLVLIFGGGLTLVLGGPTLVLLIVIAIKIMIDIRSHLKEHNTSLQ